MAQAAPANKNEKHFQKIKPEVEAEVEALFNQLRKPGDKKPVSAAELNLVTTLPGVCTFLEDFPRRCGRWPAQCVPDGQLFSSPLTEYQSAVVSVMS